MFKTPKNKNNDGFSIIEVIVVVAIFLILTSVTVYNYRDFDANINLTNLAYEMALTIREAQSYSLGVRNDDGSFDTSYGVSFVLEDGNPSTKENFIFFADKNDDFLCQSPDNGTEGSITCNYTNCNSSSECTSNISLTRGIMIEKICSLSKSSSLDTPIDFVNKTCVLHSDVEVSTEASISFKRPYIDAIIWANYGGAPGYIYPNFSDIAIILKSKNGSRRAIHVKDNGQITVNFINN